MFHKTAAITLFLFLVSCTPTYSTIDFSKYRLKTIAIYGSIKPDRSYPEETLNFINTNLEERVSQFLAEEKGYRTLVWPPTSHPKSKDLALTTARNRGANALLVLESSLTRTGTSELGLGTKFKLLSLPDKRILFAGRFRSTVDSSNRVDYASVAEGFKDFPQR